MGRAPCCEKDNVKRGPWTPEEDAKLLACIAQHGTGSWRTLPKKAGLQRCGKSCRLRWTNYLRPDLKHGRFTDHEENLIVNLHAALGSRWSLIAAQLPGRTDNDVKNYWNTRLKKKLCEMGIDPITHKPISQLLADLAGSIALPKGGEIAEAALGCFKDDMLNVLMRKRPDWQQQLPLQDQLQAGSSCIPMHQISTPAATAHHIVAGNPHHQAAAAAARAASLTSTPKNSILAGRPSANSLCDMRTAIVGLKDGQQKMEEAALAAGSQNQQLELMQQQQLELMQQQQQQRSRFCSHAGLVDQGSASCTASGSYQLLQAPQLLSNHQAVIQENQVLQMPKSGLGIVILQDQSKNKDVVGGGNNVSMSCDGIQLNRSLNMYIGKKVAAGSIPWTHAAAGTNIAIGLGQNNGSKFTVPACSSDEQLPILPPDQAASLLSSTPAHEIQFAATTTTTGQQIFHNNPHKEYNNSTSTSSQQQQQQQQQIIKSCSTSHNNNNNNNKTHDHVLTNYEMEPWSPSMASGSSCSSTSLMATGGGAGGGGDSTGLQKVLNSDVFLWDFSELSSIMN